MAELANPMQIFIIHLESKCFANITSYSLGNSYGYSFTCFKGIQAEFSQSIFRAIFEIKKSVKILEKLISRHMYELKLTD